MAKDRNVEPEVAELEELEELEGDEELSATELDPETRARRDAALRHVRKLGDPVLRASAVAVDRFDEDLRAEIERMGELMHDALGIGLAANQVGVLHRVLVYRTDPEDEITALVNPVFEWRSDELEAAEEGCLSLPGVRIEVERPVRVRVRGRDAFGEELQIEAEGLEARVIQHEIDHLDGVLILDRVSRSVRKEAMRALRAAMENGEHEPRAAGGAGSESQGGGSESAHGARSESQGGADSEPTSHEASVA
jgi:peptide deformylase